MFLVFRCRKVNVLLLVPGTIQRPSGRGGLYYFLMYMDIAPRTFGVFCLAKYRRQCICTVDGQNRATDSHDSGACATTVNLTQGR